MVEAISASRITSFLEKISPTGGRHTVSTPGRVATWHFSSSERGRGLPELLAADPTFSIVLKQLDGVLEIGKNGTKELTRFKGGQRIDYESF